MLSVVESYISPNETPQDFKVWVIRIIWRGYLNLQVPRRSAIYCCRIHGRFHLCGNI